MTRPEYFISKKVGKAIMDYGMIKDGDRILVGVSGGKDSFSLLKILRDRLAFVPIKYEVIAAHVDQDSENAKTVKSYLKKGKYPFHIIKPIKGESENRKRPDMSPCFWCAWSRRGALFKLAAKLKCNKIALAHHKDDIIQTQLMNLFFNGEISTMSPFQKMFGGRLHIIRPLVYVEEHELKRLSRDCGFPKLPNDCKKGDFGKRAHMQSIIAELEKEHPAVKDNIFQSLKRIKKEYLIR